jgi:putative endonuclease
MPPREHGLIAVYIMASDRNGTLYVGVTSNLRQRVYRHKHGLYEGFSKKYGCHRLVWFEPFERIENAIRREKQLKRYRRSWKLRLIEEDNPQWRDLADDFEGQNDDWDSSAQSWLHDPVTGSDAGASGSDFVSPEDDGVSE